MRIALASIIFIMALLASSGISYAYYYGLGRSSFYSGSSFGGYSYSSYGYSGSVYYPSAFYRPTGYYSNPFSSYYSGSSFGGYQPRSSAGFFFRSW